MVTLRRVSRGISEHFPIRVSEWVMLWPALGMSVMLSAQPYMFETSPSYAQLARWFEEETWAAIVLLCFFLRLFGLAINGTFETFKYSAHIRAFASMVSAGFWFQFTLGFATSYVVEGGGGSGVIAYSTFFLLEVVNIHRASKDWGKNKRG